MRFPTLMLLSLGGFSMFFYKRTGATGLRAYPQSHTIQTDRIGMEEITHSEYKELMLLIPKQDAGIEKQNKIDLINSVTTLAEWRKYEKKRRGL